MLLANTVAGPILPMPKFATGVTVVITGGVTLFVGVGSPVGEFTFAVFVSEPVAGAVTVTVTLLTWPFTSVPKFQFTTPLFVVPPSEADTNVTPAGNASVTTTLLADDGPKFVTEIV